MSNPNIIRILKERGFIDAMTSETLDKETETPKNVYCGFDPTSDSLHVGNLVAMMGLAWFQKLGHTPYIILGGATGRIGDPSGKSHERPQLDDLTIEKNIEGIRKNFSRVLDFDHPTAPPVILNNETWFRDFTFIDFLRDVGRYFRVGPMLAKESVRARMESEEGISFTEFSYQLLQGYDFLYLNDTYDVTFEVGGSDQWGNITAGTELVRKARSKSVHGVTFPLLVRSDGKKFGKSEKGAIWLSPEKVSPFEFYQYFFRMPDADISQMLRLLTFMDLEEILHLEGEFAAGKLEPNTLQKRLAEELTRIIHGEVGLEVARKVTDGVKPGAETELDAETLEALANEMPSKEMERSQAVDVKFIDLLVESGLQESKGAARRLIKNGGAYLNNKKISDIDYQINASDLIDGRLLLVSVGKKNKLLIRLT